MNTETANKFAESDKKTTYSIPVLIVGVVMIVLTLAAGLWGVRNAAQVKEIDPATIEAAKVEAKALVPPENPPSRQNIETALLESQTANQPVDLNLRDIFLPTVAGDAKTPPVMLPGNSLTPPSPVVPTPKIQIGVKNNPRNSGGNNGATMATKLPERESTLLPTFESRYRLYEQQYAMAQKNQMPEPKIGTIYAVSEVLPVGVIETKDRKIANFEVNQPNQAGFSLEKGERLFDATVSEITSEGVLYLFEDGRQMFTPYLDNRGTGGKGAVRRNPAPATNQPIYPPAAPVGELFQNDAFKTFSKLSKVPEKPNFDFLMAWVPNNKPPGVSKVVMGMESDTDYFHPADEFNAKNLLSSDSSSKKRIETSFCDPQFVGDTIRYTSRANLTLYEFLRNLQEFFGVSFIVDKDVADDEVVIRVADKPWNYVLEGILRSKNLEARCQIGDIISIEPKGKQAKVDQENQKSEPTYNLPYPIQYLPLSGGASVQITGSAGGSGNGGGGNSNGNGGSGFGIGIESQLQSQLRAIDPRASVVRVANTSSLSVTTTAKGHEAVVKFLGDYDKPGFQVQIETNFYTVNDSLLTDIGGQFSAIIGNPAGNIGGGISNLPPAQTTGGTGTGRTTTSPNFPTLPGVGNPTDALRAGAANTLLGARFTIGSATFNALISAAENKGLANVQSRTTQTTLNGGTAEISAGDTIILPTTALGGGGGQVNSGAITINATQSARIQPQVATDKNGNPIAVTLSLQLTNNSINRAQSSGATPVVATQTQSTTVRLSLDETFVIGGFFTDAVVNTRNRTPGVSKIPGIGELFKRRINQVDRNRLYFAITVRVVRDTALPATPAPSDIDTRPVPPPAPQTPDIRDPKDKAARKMRKEKSGN